MAKLLLAHACDPNLQDRDGRTALHIAAHEDWHMIVEHLIHAGCNLNATTTGGMTPLFCAVANGSVYAAKLLGDAGAHYEVSQGAGTVLRARVGARILGDPRKPDSIHSRNYREVEPLPLHLRNSHTYELRVARSPYNLENLRPQGPKTSNAAHKFTIGCAADRYAHPAAKYLGSQWNTGGKLNEEILKNPIKQPNAVSWRGSAAGSLVKFKANASNAERSMKSGTGTFM